MQRISKRLALLSLPMLAPLGAAIPASAAPAAVVQSPAAREVRLGTTSIRESYNSLRQSVALLPQGGYATVWDTQNGNASDVLMQWVRPDVVRPFSTALRASRPAPIRTLGLDVLVQEVIAAMTTSPWPMS